MPIKNFFNVGQVGVITDVPNFELPPNGWSDANNVRFVGNHIEAMRGFDSLYPQSSFNNGNSDKYVNCLTVRNLSTGLGNFEQEIIVATEKDFYGVNSAGTVRVLSKNNDGYHATRKSKWFADSLSNAIVLANPNDVPQGLNASGTGSDRFQDLPGWGKTFADTDSPVEEYWRTPIIRPYKNFLLAMSTVEGSNADGNDAIEYKQRIRWSDIAEINRLPLSWDAADTKRSAGYNDLTDSSGQILDGLPLRDNFIVYTTDDVFIMQYVGGNQIFIFRKLFSTSGIIATGAVAEFEGQHVVVSKDDIYVHNGQSYKTIAKGKIRERFFREVKSGREPENIMVRSHPSKKEIWVMYRTTPARADYHSAGYYYGDEVGTYNKAAIWNWQYDTWTFRDLPKVTCAESLPVVTSSITVWKDPENKIGIQGTWNSPDVEQDTWNTYGLIEGDWNMNLGSSLGDVWRADVGTKIPFRKNDTTGVIEEKNMNAFMERSSVDFRVEEYPMDSFKKLKYIYPQFVGKGTITVKVGETDNSPKISKLNNTFDFDIVNDYKADFRTNSRYLSIRFECTSQVDWRLADYSIDFEIGSLK